LVVPRILVMDEDTILGYAIWNLLRTSQENIAVMASEAQIASELASEINDLNPDVILAGKSNPLANKEVLINILMSNKKITLILVEEDSNWLQVFRREDVLMAASRDLIKLIQSV